jgi:hypothetical protein
MVANSAAANPNAPIEPRLNMSVLPVRRVRRERVQYDRSAVPEILPIYHRAARRSNGRAGYFLLAR